MEELEQPEVEESKRAKLANGTVPDGTCSPTSSHPSSQNFAVGSGYSEHSCVAEAVKLATFPTAGTSEGQTPAVRDDDLLEGKLAGEDLPGQDRPNNRGLDELLPLSKELPQEGDAVSTADSWANHSAEQQNSTGSEDDLSEEPEMESLYPQLDSHSLAVTDLTTTEVSPVSSSGVTYAVSYWVGRWGFSGSKLLAPLSFGLQCGSEAQQRQESKSWKALLSMRKMHSNQYSIIECGSLSISIFT